MSNAECALARWDIFYACFLGSLLLDFPSIPWNVHHYIMFVAFFREEFVQTFNHVKWSWDGYEGFEGPRKEVWVWICGPFLLYGIYSFLKYQLRSFIRIDCLKLKSSHRPTITTYCGFFGYNFMLCSLIISFFLLINLRRSFDVLLITLWAWF